MFATAEAPAGSLEVDSPNESSVDHDIAIEGSGVTRRARSSRTAASRRSPSTLKPGNYTFFCSVPGHRDGGMEGKLTVK